MQISTIRNKYIQFFSQKNHKHLPAAPLINQDDPNLLFINAGMNPFKNIFLGHQHPESSRIVTSQPCLRVTGKHNDLEEVGVDTYHHTLFEMLGNWSFGNYFKKEAIAWAWELLTEVYHLPPETLYVTVFKGDDSQGLAPDKEAFELWKKYLPETHLLYASKEDNFWEMGTMGPCGPCSEIHIDLRTKKEQATIQGSTLVNTNHPQVIELWNLVFMQYNRQASGLLTPLPMQHVDTGIGLERLAMVLQHKPSTYETDAFTTLIQATSKASNTIYGKNPTTDIALRVIADHIRAITFAIAEGGIPSSQKAGYVIRRILRRALRYGYTYLGFKNPFLYNLVPIVIHTLGKTYPNLKKQQPFIQKTIHQEETTFINTLAHGLKRFTHITTHLPKKTKIIKGQTVFELYDTYGFPPDLTALIAREQGLTIDQQGFKKAMQEQKERSQQVDNVQQSDWHLIQKKQTTTFVGYDQLQTTSYLVKYRTLQNKKGSYYQLVLDKTPFYAEGGGQVGDTGLLKAGKQVIKVTDTQKENDLIVHYTTALPKDLQAPLLCVVDKQRRAYTTNNHTATHLMAAALRQVLGKHIQQKGSLVNEKALRFDFSHTKPLTKQQIQEIERLVNEKIQANIPLHEQRQVPIEKAKSMGAIILIGEKYSKTVRIVAFDTNYSIELCGGTHVAATGQIGFFKIIGEKGIGAGIRRIEALTAYKAEQWVQKKQTTLDTIINLLKNSQQPIKALTQLIESHKSLQQAHRKLIKTQQQALQKSLEEKLQYNNNIHIGIEKIQVENANDLRKIAFALKKNHKSLLLVLATIVANKPYLAVAVSQNLTEQYNAHKIIQELATHIKGKGGGHPFFAIAGGQHLAGIDKALQVAHSIFKQKNNNPHLNKTP